MVENSRMAPDPEQGTYVFIFEVLLFLPPATKLGQGYIFTGVCDSVHGGGCLLSGGSGPGGGGDVCSQGVPGPGGVSGPGGVPGGDPPGYCCGRYASYWNAFLFYHVDL